MAVIQEFSLRFARPQTPREQSFDRTFVVYTKNPEFLEQFTEDPFLFPEFSKMLDRMWFPFPEKEIIVQPESPPESADLSRGGGIDLYLGALLVTRNYN